jgi:type IV secretion system protein VirB2
MALAVEQSLLEAGGEAPMVESARWIEGVMLGEIALGLRVIAVAFLGALMLTGRLALPEGGRIVVGCFVLLGARVIAFGLMQISSWRDDTSPPLPPIAAETAVPRGDMPPASHDTYAGASLRQN